jgi:hypothetical protein
MICRVNSPLGTEILRGLFLCLSEKSRKIDSKKILDIDLGNCRVFFFLGLESFDR